MATEQSIIQNGNGLNRKEGSDIFTDTVRSLDGCEDRLQRMQAAEKLHDVSLKVVQEINHVVDSSINDELKQKALTVLHVVSNNAAHFESFVIGYKQPKSQSSSGQSGQRRI